MVAATNLVEAAALVGDTARATMLNTLTGGESGHSAVLALLRIAGCAQYVGKGKAPPPVVTKG